MAARLREIGDLYGDEEETGERREKAHRVHSLLLDAYGDHAWHSRSDPLSELVQTILSQQTSDLNSGRAFAALRDRFPTWEAVRDAPTEAVAAAIRGSGLSNIKAPRIQQVLRQIEPEGRISLNFLRDMSAPDAKAWLRALPGVGPKTAACVLLFSLCKPALPVDTHVYRVSQRLGLIGPRVTVERAHDELEALVPPAAYYSFHLNMITHGRQVCHSQRPVHDLCNLRLECDYYRREAALAAYRASEELTL